ncbi:NmrA family transcriptional regulator [Spongiactinospora gelatinilytica]|uniref:NmrA family transcriptional regulator n=1 Tax=Spongiactinospora gelatinilytica TaxID=2666298 RepID=A0A2W2H6B3_9ACTN|nr:NAD(P)H-binding protein [Spongiactinospora gelatinilytica]PZG50389.1 NmrA family transcriptional regulator [Spongiactinospora gelatinilytica]
MRILMTGATGNVGRLVVDRLVRAGVTVRALSRDPARARVRFAEDVEVVEGDLARPQSMAPALKGVDGMYLFPHAATAPQVVALAGEAGVRRIVVLSSGAVTTGYDTDFHLPVEHAVESSGLEWTHVRPGEFMLNKLWLWGPSIRAERIIREPLPDAAWYPVHEQDIADVATAALIEDGHQGAAYTLNGPELITRRAQVAAIAAAIGAEIRLEVVTPAQARELYLAQGGFAADNADFLTGFKDYSGAEADPSAKQEFDLAMLGPMSTAEEVTGRPTRTFAEWAHDHARDFLAGVPSAGF